MSNDELSQKVSAIEEQLKNWEKKIEVILKEKEGVSRCVTEKSMIEKDNEGTCDERTVKQTKYDEIINELNETKALLDKERADKLELRENYERRIEKIKEACSMDRNRDEEKLDFEWGVLRKETEYIDLEKISLKLSKEKYDAAVAGVQRRPADKPYSGYRREGASRYKSRYRQ